MSQQTARPPDLWRQGCQLGGMTAQITRPNCANHATAQRNFFDCITNLSDRIDYRIADTAQLQGEIFRLRLQAYFGDGTIFANSSGIFSDRYDERGNFYLWDLWIDDELVSSVRIHVPSKEDPDFPHSKYSRVCYQNLRPAKSSLM